MCFVFVLFDFETQFCYVAPAILKFLGSSNLLASASQVAGTTTLGLETIFLPLLFYSAAETGISKLESMLIPPSRLVIYTEELCALLLSGWQLETSLRCGLYGRDVGPF